VATDTDPLDGGTAVVVSADGTGDDEPLDDAPPGDPPPEEPEPDGLDAQIASRLADVAVSLERLAESAQRYHVRAEQREAIIDQFSAELERLRRGERRGLLRPLLVEVCRLRADLLRQAEELPDDFDAERARLLLRSYADTVDLMLGDNGVTAYSPGAGDGFDPRAHRQAGTVPAPDGAAVGTIASVRRNGYLDVDSGAPVAPAEVVVFVRVPAGNIERNDQ
jgi:hypothetical protein